jgi:hypothetical protein
MGGVLERKMGFGYFNSPLYARRQHWMELGGYIYHTCLSQTYLRFSITIAVVLCSFFSILSDLVGIKGYQTRLGSRFVVGLREHPEGFFVGGIG